jgi:hypothetical protein
MSEHYRSLTEAQCLAELTSTEVSPRTARVMSWLFVVLIGSVPLLQLTIELGRRQSPQALVLFQPLRATFAQVGAGHPHQAWSSFRSLLSASYLHAYEGDVERASLAKRFVQPHLQVLLSGLGGFGNEKCVLGRHGWLFYQPGLKYVLGPDVLSESELRRQAKRLAEQEGAANPQPDPRPAILQFQDDCARVGVHLVVVPVPDKASLQPGQLTRRLKGAGPRPVAANRGYPRLLEELRAHGVDVFDPSPSSVLVEEWRYLKEDTHWTPAYMEEVAFRLAKHIQAQVALPPVNGYYPPTIIPRCITFRGDLVSMLGMPPSQSLFPPETVTVHEVFDSWTNRPWEPDPQADVLLLGDSFTNVYSDGEGKHGLGWGKSAGFGAQLSYRLERPVDVIARNGAGATQTRAELARRPDPLGGKRVVIWEFAARDLALAEWQPIPLKRSILGALGESGVDSKHLVVDATVLAVSQVPQPYSVPYKDCLTFIKVRVDRIVEGTCRHRCLIAAFWCLKDNQLQPAARHAPGDRFQLKLLSLLHAAKDLGTVRYADDLNDYEHPTYYVEEERQP